MRRVLKWIGIGLGGIVIIVVAAFLVLYGMGRARLNQTYSVQAEEVSVEDDEATLARGQHLVEAVGACGECHGEGLRGAVMVEDPALGTIVASNLTGGEGGVAAIYDDADWVRAIRHGVDPDDKPLLVMPAQDFSNLSAEDLGAVITYVKTLPPVDNEPPAGARKETRARRPLPGVPFGSVSAVITNMGSVAKNTVAGEALPLHLHTGKAVSWKTHSSGGTTSPKSSCSAFAGTCVTRSAIET